MTLLYLTRWCLLSAEYTAGMALMYGIFAVFLLMRLTKQRYAVLRLEDHDQKVQKNQEEVEKDETNRTRVVDSWNKSS